ncbi:MAG: 5-formyltetrahydrofolate cyclo-ligase [Thermoproteota archaeon]|nr:5-formyltetrahydrofolate cyclo-ligase [Thermoproteota archaeon]MDQ4101055.1 5-formyltetrahydrofolate cyclo-ligase [Thermoproteota archaeon]
MLKIRNKLNSEEVAKRSKIIQEFVINTEEFRQAKVVGAYFAIGSEVMTELIIGRTKMLGKKIALPRVEGDEIIFYELPLTNTLVKGRFGIMEPPPHDPADKIDVLVVPGIAFDKKGNRLGYGKGFYDRLLSSNLTKFSFGLAYSFQVIENLPHEDHDKRLDAIASEDGIYYVT